MTTLAPAADTATATSTRTAVVAGGLVGALGSAAYAASVVVAPDLTVREAATHPLVLTANVVVALAFVALAVTIRGLAELTGLPRWALAVTAAGCAFVGAVALTQATALPHMVGLISDAEAELSSGYLVLMWLPKIALCAVGLAGLAVAGWRRRSLSRGLCVLLAVAGLVSVVPPYPPGALLTGLALAWLARSAPHPTR